MKKNKNHDSRELNITETQTNFTTPGHQLKLLAINGASKATAGRDLYNV